MLNHDPAESAFCESTLLDEIEPESDAANLYREAARKHLAFLISTLHFIGDAKMLDELWLRTRAVMVCLDHPMTAGLSQTEIAVAAGYDKAALNKHVQYFRRAMGLPPTLGQKSKEACCSYSKARKAQLK